MVVVVWLARPSHLIAGRSGLAFKWANLLGQTSSGGGPSGGPACVDEVCHMTSCYTCVDEVCHMTSCYTCVDKVCHMTSCYMCVDEVCHMTSCYVCVCVNV